MKLSEWNQGRKRSQLNVFRFDFIRFALLPHNLRCESLLTDNSLNVRFIVFDKLGRVASNEVTIQLFNSTAYVLEACLLSKSDLCSIDFAFNRFFMKLFRTIETVKVSQSYFSINLPSVVLQNRLAWKSLNKNLNFMRSYLRSLSELTVFVCNLSCLVTVLCCFDSCSALYHHVW